METIFDTTLIDARRVLNSSIDELQYEYECSKERALEFWNEAWAYLASMECHD